MSEASPSPRRPTPLRGAFVVAGLGAVWLLAVTPAWANSPDLGHAWAVPLLMGYLWWERWTERPRGLARPGLAPGWWVLAAVLVLAALPLRLLLTPFPLWPALQGSFALLLAAVALVAGWLWAGKAGLRWVGGPLILMVSSVPVPSLLESAIIIPLREIMATLAAEISNLAGQPALAMGTSVRLGNGWVGIDEACGGIRSLQACIMIGLFFGEWYRFRLARRAGLVGAGVLVALGGNFARVLFLSLRAGAGPQAVEAAHDLAGWLAMGASLAVTGWLACRWAGYRWPQPRAAAASAAPGAPGLPAAGRWLALVVVLLLVNEGATRWWYARGEARRATVPQWTVRFPVQHGSFHAQPLAETAREMLRPDYFAAGNWRQGADLPVSAYFIEWRKGQVARSVPFLHNPTVCLPLAGCELVGALDPINVTWSGGEIPFFAYKFRQAGEELLVAFTIWDSARGRPMVRVEDGDSWRKWWAHQWGEVREARQHQPAQMLTVSLLWREDAPRTMQGVLSGLITAPEPINRK